MNHENIKNKEYFNREYEEYKKAGEVAKKVKEYSKKIIKPGKPLLEIANEIETKIEELGGKIAFPVNLSVDDIAAHYTPSHDSKEKAEGLLKIDIGIHINGYIADTAFSIDLEDNEENKKLIKATDAALKKAIENANENIKTIGRKIQKEIESYGFSPIKNLQGHKLEKYNLHAGINIPNYDDGNEKKLPKGYYAIEPFSTNGAGSIYEGKPSGIYILKNKKPVRLNRKILEFIENYEGLPFCSRWVVKKFGKKALFALNRFEQKEIIKQFPQLIEKDHGKVSQSEHTICLKNNIEILS